MRNSSEVLYGSIDLHYKTKTSQEIKFKMFDGTRSGESKMLRFAKQVKKNGGEIVSIDYDWYSQKLIQPKPSKTMKTFLSIAIFLTFVLMLLLMDITNFRPDVFQSLFILYLGVANMMLSYVYFLESKK